MTLIEDLTKKSKEELASRVKDLESFIAKKGIGSKYVSKVEKIQRRANIALFFGAITAVAGIVAWMAINSNDEDED